MPHLEFARFFKRYLSTFRVLYFVLRTCFNFCRQEVNEVMTSLRKSLGDVSKDAQAAVASLGSVEGVVEQV